MAMQGLTLLQDFRPDVAVVDFLMPGLNGAQVARAAQALHQGLPIVFVNGYSDTLALEQITDAVLLRNLRTKTYQSPPAPGRRVAAQPRLALVRPPRSSSLQAPSIAGRRLALISLSPARALAKKSMVRRGAHLPKLAAV